MHYQYFYCKFTVIGAYWTVILIASLVAGVYSTEENEQLIKSSVVEADDGKNDQGSNRETNEPATAARDGSLHSVDEQSAESTSTINAVTLCILSMLYIYSYNA